MTVSTHHYRVQRTVRYHSIGDARTAADVWVVLHGYGQLARYFLRKFEGLAEHAYIVAPEGPNRFYLDEGHERVGANWMTREDREHEIEDHVAQLDALVERLAEACGAPPRVHVLGFSQGVATAWRWAMLGGSRVRSMVLWSGAVPNDVGAGLVLDRCMDMRLELVGGEQDSIVPMARSMADRDRLLDLGLQVGFHTHPGGHVLDPLLLWALLWERAGGG